MSRAEAKARTRAALLASAREVFIEKGFNAATIEEIAGRAGFTRGAFYANFADKSEAFWAVAEAEDALVFGDLETDLEAADDAGKLDLVETWFQRLLADRPLHPAFSELVAQSPSAQDRARFADLLAANRRRIARVIETERRARGVSLPAPVEDIAAIFLALGEGLSTQRTFDPEAIPFSLFADAFAYLWLGAIMATKDPSMLSRGTGTPTRSP